MALTCRLKGHIWQHALWPVGPYERSRFSADDTYILSHDFRCRVCGRRSDVPDRARAGSDTRTNGFEPAIEAVSPYVLTRFLETVCNGSGYLPLGRVLLDIQLFEGVRTSVDGLPAGVVVLVVRTGVGRLLAPVFAPRPGEFGLLGFIHDTQDAVAGLDRLGRVPEPHEVVRWGTMGPRLRMDRMTYKVLRETHKTLHIRPENRRLLPAMPEADELPHLGSFTAFTYGG